jgi:hypothetical protein
VIIESVRVKVRDWFRRWGETVFGVAILALLLFLVVDFTVLAVIDTFHFLVFAALTAVTLFLFFLVHVFVKWLMK